MKKSIRLALLGLVLILLMAACGKEESAKTGKSKNQFVTEAGSKAPLKILSGSENKVLEDLLEVYAKKTGQKIQMTYMGSLDMMHLLQADQVEYDALWPASSLWLNMGDRHHRLKHRKTVAVSPVVFGIRRSLAEKLHFLGRKDVKVRELMDEIEKGHLSFSMTSATQSNSGASAYLAFLTALADHGNQGLRSDDLKNPALQKEIKTLLSGVNRASASSQWLVDLFLMAGDYDAMVNYEQLIIQTNLALEKAGKEPLYLVYPVDGLSLSDAPLAYVDRGDDQKEQAFLDFQNFLLSEEGQDFIERTGKRNAFAGVALKNRSYFRKEWGIDLDRTLSPIRFPANETITEALQLYQTSFKKPAFTVYVLDYSGSMSGKGHEEMVRALKEIWDPERAKLNLLLGTEGDRSVFLPFASDVGTPMIQDGNQLKSLLVEAETRPVQGGTHLYEAVKEAMTLLLKQKDLDRYTPAIVLLTDGRANGALDYEQFKAYYETLDLDVPIFSIYFGHASQEEIEKLATLSRARIFNGAEDLIESFKQVKGYN